MEGSAASPSTSMSMYRSRRKADRAVGGDEVVLGPHAPHHRQVVPVDLVVLDREAPTALDLALGAEVDHRAQAERPRLLEVGAGEALHAIGPEQRPSTRGAAVAGRQPAEIADVEHELER